MKDTEARTTLEKCDVEEVCPPERIERNFLEDFLDGIFLLERILRTILPQLFLDDVNHSLAVPEVFFVPAFSSAARNYRTDRKRTCMKSSHIFASCIPYSA